MPSKVLSKKAISKLRVKYFGPNQVLEKCGQLAYYKLDLFSDVQIHHIFHVSRVRKKFRDPTKIVSDLPIVDKEERVSLQPTKS